VNLQCNANDERKTAEKKNAEGEIDGQNYTTQQVPQSPQKPAQNDIGSGWRFVFGDTASAPLTSAHQGWRKE
jgi:hypothetical protein